MSTENLIADLVRDFQPVIRASRPGVLFAKWSAVSLLYVAIGTLFIGTRNDLAEMWSELDSIVHTLLVLSVAVLAATIAFKASIPDRAQRFLIMSLFVALTAWFAWIVIAVVTAGEPHAGHGWKCVRNIVVIALPLGALMYSMISRAAPLRTGTVGWLAALSAAAAADFATRFICRNDHAVHSLIWHFLPVLALSCAGVLLGRVAFRWEGARRSAGAEVQR